MTERDVERVCATVDGLQALREGDWSTALNSFSLAKGMKLDAGTAISVTEVVVAEAVEDALTPFLLMAEHHTKQADSRGEETPIWVHELSELTMRVTERLAATMDGAYRLMEKAASIEAA